MSKQIRRMTNKELYEASSKQFDGEYLDFLYKVRLEIKRREKNEKRR